MYPEGILNANFWYEIGNRLNLCLSSTIIHSGVLKLVGRRKIPFRNKIMHLSQIFQNIENNWSTKRHLTPLGRHWEAYRGANHWKHPERKLKPYTSGRRWTDLELPKFPKATLWLGRVPSTNTQWEFRRILELYYNLASFSKTQYNNKLLAKPLQIGWTWNECLFDWKWGGKACESWNGGELVGLTLLELHRSQQEE